MTIDQMWEKFEAHQPVADELGYGPEWRRMCEERTEEAATAVGYKADAENNPTRAAAWSARLALATADRARVAAANAESLAKRAIEYIERAEGKDEKA